MLRLFKLLFWSLAFVLLLIVVDQVMLRTPPVHPAHAALREFYHDFRGRLLRVIEVVPSQGPESIEAVIEDERDAVRESSRPSETKADLSSQAPPAESGSRYVYVDRQGVLQFADSLEDIPEAERESAQPLGE